MYSSSAVTGLTAVSTPYGAASSVRRRPVGGRHAGAAGRALSQPSRRPSHPRHHHQQLHERRLPAALLAVPRRACLSGADAIKQTSVGDAAEKLETGWTYLDVRTVEEFQEQRVPGSINVPVFTRGPEGMVPNPDFAAAALEALPKDTSNVLVGCKSGQRSQAAIQQLASIGCNFEMENVDGGIMAWGQAQLPLET